MSYCPHCGRKILEESLGCPFCSVKDNIDYSRSGQERMDGLQREESAEPQTDTAPKAEPATDFTVEESDTRDARRHFAAQQPEPTFTQTEPVQEKRLPPVLKIVVFVAVFMVGFFGQVVGAIAGAVLMKKESEEYHRFGKALLIFCIVLLAIEVVGAILFTVVSTNMMTYFLIN